MRKVKYVGSNSVLLGLTKWKVYGVISYRLMKSDFKMVESFTIITDDGKPQSFFYNTIDVDFPLFEDVSYLYRNEVIDNILN